MRKVLVLAGDARDVDKVSKKASALGFETVNVMGEPDDATLERAALDASACGILAINAQVRDVVARVTATLNMASLGDAATFGAWTMLTDGGVATPRQHIVAAENEAETALGDVGTPAWFRPAALGGTPFRMTLDHAADLGLVIGKVQGYAGGGPVLVQRPVEGAPCRVVGFKCGREFFAVECVNEQFGEAAFEVPFAMSLPFAGGGLAYEKAVAMGHKVGDLLPTGSYAVEIGLVMTASGPVVTRVHTPVRFEAGLVALLLNGYGVDLEADQMRVAAGLQPAEVPRRAAGAAVRWFNVGSGTVKGIEGIDEAAAMPGVQAVEVHAQPADDVGHIIDRGRRDALGWVLATGGRRADAEARAQAAMEKVSIATRKVN